MSAVWRAAQMVIAANGHHKVPFEDLLVAGAPGWQVRANPRFGTLQYVMCVTCLARVAVRTCEEQSCHVCEYCRTHAAPLMLSDTRFQFVGLDPTLPQSCKYVQQHHGNALRCCCSQLC